MKTLVIFLVLAFAANFSNAQELIELNEARVNYSPYANPITKVGKTYNYTIEENYFGEFEKDPLAFVKNHFDIQKLIKELEDENYYSYKINFKSRKGSLLAEFDHKGRLMFTSQKFENIALPNAVCQQLYRDHKGWAMIDNTHVARSKNGEMKQNYYKVTMKNGNQIRRIKIDVPAAVSSALVGN